MAGYIGKSQGVTQVDGYNRSEADTRYVNTAGDTMTGNLVTPMVVANSALSNRNLIINGAMQVAQRGTSANGTGYKTVDRMNLGGGATTNTDVSQARQTLSSSDTPYAEGFRYSWKMTNNTATSNSNDYVEPTYQIENQDLVTSGWNYTDPNSDLTLQFWVKSSLAGTYYVRFLETSGTLHSYVSPVVLEAGVWKKVVLTTTGDAALDIPLNNGSNFRINFNIHYGAAYTDNSCPLNQWHVFSGPAEYPDFLQNWKNTAGATFEITGVQLEVGDTATPFEHRSYGQELALCQRYYFSINAGGHPSPTDGPYTRYDGVQQNADEFNWYPQYPVPMRATPSLIKNNLSSSTIQVFNATTQTTPTFTDMVNAEGGILSGQVRVQTNGTISNGDVGSWRWGNVPNSSVGFDAEL